MEGLWQGTSSESLALACLQWKQQSRRISRVGVAEQGGAHSPDEAPQGYRFSLEAPPWPLEKGARGLNLHRGRLASPLLAERPRG